MEQKTAAYRNEDSTKKHMLKNSHAGDRSKLLHGMYEFGSQFHAGQIETSQIKIWEENTGTQMRLM